MLTFTQLAEKKSKIKINPKKEECLEDRKHKEDCQCQKCEDKEEEKVVEGSAYGLWKGDGKRKLPGDKKKKEDVKEAEVVSEADPRLAIYQSGITDASRVKGRVGKAVDKVKDKVKKVLGKKDKVSSHLDRYRFQSGMDNYLKSKVKKEEVEEVDEKISASGYARAKKWREDQARQKDREDNAKWEEKARTHKWDGKKWNKRDKPTHEKGTGPHARKLAGESVEYELEEERAARKMNVRTKGTIKKQIAKDAAAEAKRRANKTGEYKEKPKKRPSLKKPSQLTKVTGTSKPEPKKEAPKPKAKPAAKKAAPKPKAEPKAKAKPTPKAKPVAAVKKVTPKAKKKEAPRTQKGAMAYDGPNKARSQAADRVKAKTKAKQKSLPKKEAPKKSGVGDRVRDAIKKGVKRHRKATQGARVFGKGFVKGAKDTVKFAGKVKKAVVGEERLTFKQFVNEAKVDAGKSPETKEKDRNVRKFGVSHNVAGHGKLRRALHRSNRGDKKIKGDKSQYVETESVNFDEATRLKKEKGYDKGGTKKPSGRKDAALAAVLAKIKKEHGAGAVMGQGSRQQKKVKGAKSTAGTGKYKKAADNKKQTAADAKKRGFSNVQNYVDTMARYGGKSNYDKGRGLGT